MGGWPVRYMQLWGRDHLQCIPRTRTGDGSLDSICSANGSSPKHCPSADTGRGAGGHRDLRSLQRLFEAQDGRRLGQLVRGMAGLKGGEAVFEVWMKQQSDTVQVSRGSMCSRPQSTGLDRRTLHELGDESAGPGQLSLQQLAVEGHGWGRAWASGRSICFGRMCAQDAGHG